MLAKNLATYTAAVSLLHELADEGFHLRAVAIRETGQMLLPDQANVFVANDFHGYALFSPRRTSTGTPNSLARRFSSRALVNFL
jgi:hypothetical protein